MSKSGHILSKIAIGITGAIAGVIIVKVIK